MINPYSVTDWTEYRHGVWRRVGSSIEVYCDNENPIMPAGIIPEIEPYLLKNVKNEEMWTWHFKVKVKGWTNYVTGT